MSRIITSDIALDREGYVLKYKTFSEKVYSGESWEVYTYELSDEVFTKDRDLLENHKNIIIR